MSATEIADIDWSLLGAVESQAGGDAEAAFVRVLADQVQQWQERPPDEPRARTDFLAGWDAAVAERGS